MAISTNSPIGVYDSGVGGLSVLRAIREIMPEEEILYLGDQVQIPYGPRPMEQIRNFSEAITRFLLEHKAKIIVVACNTASAAALQYLRSTFPDIPFVALRPLGESLGLGRGFLVVRRALAQAWPRGIGAMLPSSTGPGGEGGRLRSGAIC